MEKLNPNRRFDLCMKNSLENKASEVEPTGELFRNIQTDIYEKEREYYTMNNTKKFRKINPVVIVILIFILSAATCVAASQINSYVTYSTKTFEEYPSKWQVKSAVDYIPNYVKEFSNGFTFKNASVDDTTAKDVDDNPIAKGKGITFYYEKSDSVKGQILACTTDKDFGEVTSDSDLTQEVIKSGNIDLKYSHVESKVVPEGYVPTAEENQRMDKGNLWMSYGSTDKEETDKIQFIQWTKDGISYALMDRGYELPKDELIKMAEETIASNK